MSYSFDWQRDFREGIREGTTLRLLPLDDGKEAEFTVIKETGRGGSVITYEVLYQRSGTTERCYLKELYPEHICENENLFRTSDGFSLAVSHGFGEESAREKDFSLIDSEEGALFIQDYKNIKELRLNVDSAPLFICDAQEVYCNKSTYYVKVPFETNETLKDYIDKTELTLNDILLLGRELASMTQKLHDEGYLHLDIKPENLLCKCVDKKNSQKTLSFLDTGTIARIDDINKIKYLPSSPGYSSPEQEFLHKIDSKHPKTTDIFSIGAVIFKMLTGEKPSEADCRKKEFDFTKNKTLYADCNYSKLRKLNVLLCKTLSVSPSLRFHSCEEVVTQIQSVLNSSTNPFDRAIDRMHFIFSNKPDSENESDNKHVFFSWGDETFEKDMFPQVSYGISNKRYDSLYELICDYRDNKRLFWLGGRGGCGKSAHLKRLAYDLYNSEEKLYAPIYIDSNKILDTVKNDKSYAGMELKTAICKEIEMNSKPEELDNKIFSLNGCRFAIIIDGLNELDEERKESLLYQIYQIEKLPLFEKSIVIVSDRGTPYYNTENCVSISINPFDRDFIKTGLNQQNSENENLINMLCGNIYLFKKFRDLKDKDRDFESTASILSAYYNETVFDITSEIRNKKKTTDDAKKELIESLARAAFDSSRILTLTVDEDSFCRYLKEDSDCINAVKKSKLFVRSNGNLKFEHETIRDFIISFYLKEVIIDCCSSDKAPYNFTSVPDILSSPLPDDTLKYLGELLCERVANNDKDYDAFCNRLLENRAKPRGNNITEPSKNKMVRWDTSFEKQGRVLAFALYSLNCTKHLKKAQIIANIIKAMALGRGYRNTEDLIRQSPVIKKLLLHMIVNSKEMESVLPGSQNYIGTEALKRRKQQFIGLGILIFLFVFAFLPATINSCVPRVEIESTAPVSEGVWVASETDFYTGFNVFSQDNLTSIITQIISDNISPDDFITEGFTADILLNVSGTSHSVTLTNVKSLEQTSEVKECRLILKRGVIETSNGIFSRKNKETEIFRFNIFPDKDYKINTYINMDATKVKTGNTLNFVFGFNSNKSFESDISAQDLILNNFSADVTIVLDDETVIENASHYNRNYHVTLRDIQPTGDGEKSIYIPSGVAHNEYGILSYSVLSNAFEIREDVEYLPAPDVTCELFYDDQVSPGASLLMQVDFSVYDSATYDTKFSSSFAVDPKTPEKLPFFSYGFSFNKESVYISEVANNAHSYWVLLSDVYPDENAVEYGIFIDGGTAITQNGASNEFKAFTFDIPFSNVVTDLTSPAITVEPYHNNIDRTGYYYTNPTFILKISDDRILPYLSPDSIKSGIRVLNADYGNIVVKNNGGWTDKSREYEITLYDVVPKSSYENVILQFIPGAVTDSAGNLSEELRVNVFNEDTLHFYCDFQNAVVSPDKVSFGCEEVEVYNGKTEAFEATCLYSYNIEYRMKGFKANVVKVDKSNDKSMIELTNVQFDEGVDTGTLTLYAIGEDRTVYKTSILVKNQ